MKNNVGHFLHVFGKTVRVVFLQTVFGYVSECKHHPTCGDYCIEQIKKRGVVKGTIKGFQRLATCW